MKYVLLTLLLVTNCVFASIPVIDMNDLKSPATRQRFIDGLSDAFKTVGFVAVINTDVDQSILDRAYASAQCFFNLPLEKKMYANDPALHGQRGYVQSEVAQGQTRKDFKEFYHIAKDYPIQIRNQHKYVANIWPENPEFRSNMQVLMNALQKYQITFEQALSESIGQPKDYISKMTAEGDYLLRAIHYPKNPPSGAPWAAAHTDIDLYTFIPRSTAKGLQVRDNKGNWLDVEVPENAFVVNAGDMLQNLTNGVYKSSVHRVVSNGTNQERYSMVAFIHPRPNDNMGPLPQFIAKVGSKKFPDHTQKQLLDQRLVELGLKSNDAG